MNKDSDSISNHTNDRLYCVVNAYPHIECAYVYNEMDIHRCGRGPCMALVVCLDDISLHLMAAHGIMMIYCLTNSVWFDIIAV